MTRDTARHDQLAQQDLRQMLYELPEVAQPLASIVAEAAEAGAICVLATTEDGSPRIIAGTDATAIAVTEQQLDAAEHGFASTLSLPLPAAAGQAVVLVGYRRQPGGFDDRLRITLQSLADRATGALALVNRVAAVGLSRALADRSRLDIAVGVLMARHGYDPAVALEQLQRAAAAAGTDLSAAAEQILTQLPP